MGSGALFGSLFNGNAQYPTLQLTDSGSISVWRGYVQDSAAGLNTPVQAPAQPSPSPSPPAAGISGLALSPATLTPSSSNHTAISFTLNQAANVTICILNDQGAVMRTLSKPGHAAGAVSVSYYGFNGSGKALPAGSYTVLVVTSNAQGSSTAETKLTISAP
jgi:FlgD Ig-like domain